MAYCPNCRAPMNDDFGLQTCEACKAQVFATLDDVPPAPPQTQSLPEIPANMSLMSEEIFSASVDAGPPQGWVQPEPTPGSEGMDLIEENFMKSISTRAPAPQPTSTDMTELSDFANSEKSSVRDGFLRFNIYISGIDTIDLKKSVKEVLSDQKFRLNVDLIFQNILQGRIVLKDISAIKTALLVQRLRPLSLEIRWEQYAIHQS